MWMPSCAIWSKCWHEGERAVRSDTDTMLKRLDTAGRRSKRESVWRDQAIPALMPLPLTKSARGDSFPGLAPSEFGVEAD